MIVHLSHAKCSTFSYLLPPDFPSLFLFFEIFLCDKRLLFLAITFYLLSQRCKQRNDIKDSRYEGRNLLGYLKDPVFVDRTVLDVALKGILGLIRWT